MSCTHLTTCYEAGTTYKDKLLDFPDETTGLTDFRYIVKAALGETILTLTEGNGIVRIQDNKLCIQSAQLQDLSLGSYSATVFFKINGNDRKLFTEDLEITEDGCDCANIYNLSFSVVTVDITENIVNIYLNADDLTPEQIAVFQQPALDAAVTANAAAQNADQKAALAQEKADLADAAATDASTAADNAQSAADLATEVATHPNIVIDDFWYVWNPQTDTYENMGIKAKGDKGDPFTIFKSYPTILEMEADFANVPDGSFVAISSNVDDPDNAKLYLRGTSAFTFVTDMSGTQGIKGDTGYTGWSPIEGLEEDGSRLVRKITGYAGGTGTLPSSLSANIGKYYKADGTLTATKAEGADVKADITSYLGFRVLSKQLFNKNDFRNDTSIISNGALSTPVIGAQTTMDIPIPRDLEGNLIYTHVSISGLTAGYNKRMRFLTSTGEIITPIPTQFAASRTQEIPVNAYSFTVGLRADNEPSGTTPIETAMINFGSVALPYEDYKQTVVEIKDEKITATAFIKDGQVVDSENVLLKTGDLKVYLSETLDKWYVRIPFSATHDLVHSWALDPVNLIPDFYRILKLGKTVEDGETVFSSNQLIKGAEDDISLIRMDNNYLISGGHGSTVRTVNLAHDKDSGDLLSIWNDSGREWRLIEIPDANTLKLIPLPYSTPNGIWVNPNLVSTTLTHVSGAVNTGNINASSSTTTGLAISTMDDRTYQLILDDKVIVTAGLYIGDEFKIVDNHTIVDVRDLTPQIPFKMNEGGRLFTEKITYSYDRYNNCAVDYVIDSHSDVFIEQHGFTQFSRAITSLESAGQTLLYIPDSGSISNGTTTYNLATTPTNIFNPLGGSSLIYTPANIPNPDKPIFRVIEVEQTTTGVKKQGFVHGYSLEQGITVDANRKSLAELWEIRGNSAKSYPSGIRKYSLTTSSLLQAKVYRSIFNSELNPDFTAVYFYKEGENFFVFIDAHKNLSKKAVKLHPDLIGKKCEVFRTGGNMQLLTDYVSDAAELYVNCTAYGYLILKLN